MLGFRHDTWQLLSSWHTYITLARDKQRRHRQRQVHDKYMYNVHVDERHAHVQGAAKKVIPCHILSNCSEFFDETLLLYSPFILTSNCQILFNYLEM